MPVSIPPSSVSLGRMVMFVSHSTRRIAFQIDTVNKIFVENLNSPPLYKNHPPVAGAIYWERSLFFRMKHTILRLQEVAEILDSDRGREVRCVAGTAPAVCPGLQGDARVRSSSRSDPCLTLRRSPLWSLIQGSDLKCPFHPFSLASQYL